ncbi:MAG TPA: CU044_2847 family protein [Streptosporangiaceae bacterium]|nr:CU044_2847 family protein [Streptosporangiaceae bacterium]
MSELMAVPLDGGGTVVVECGGGPSPGGVVKAGRGVTSPPEVAVRAAQTLELALEPVTAAARVTLAKLREAGPDEVLLEFGLRLTAEVGAVITRTAGECNLKVTLRWERAGGDDRG